MRTDHTMFGVKGKLEKVERSDGLFSRQKFYASRQVQWEGRDAQINVEVDFDDDCNNGHQSFGITGSMKHIHIRGGEVAGCIHEQIEKHFPELAHLTPWHGVSTDGPMHYLANTIYHASDRDHNGRLKGEPTRFEIFARFLNCPALFKLKSKGMEQFLLSLSWQQDPSVLDVVAIEHVNRDGTNYQFGPKFDFKGRGIEEWHKADFDSEAQARAFAEAVRVCDVEIVRVPTAFSEGKERNLDAARRAAHWPEATDEQLCLPKDELKKLLDARMPAQVAEFREAMESCGFEWREKEKPV